MKILMVNKFLYPRGGAESYMLKLADSLVAMGHSVEYFGMYDEKNTVKNSVGAYTQNMDFHSTSASRLLYPFKILYSAEAKRKIKKVIADFKPDVVHLNNINFQLTPSIIEGARQMGVPVVQTVHDYQMTCPNHLLYDFANKCVCERCVAKNKFHCIRHKCIHGSTVKSILGTLEYYLYRIRGTYKSVHTYICPSYFLESKLMKNAPEIYGGKTAVLHNFVEKHENRARTSNFDFPYVAFAGRLSGEKGIGVLAEAAKLLPDVHFVVMGNGPEEHAFDGLANVHLTGFVTGEELVTNIACAEVLAVPSVCFENCPLSILEAQTLGVPSVTMPMGGMAELVEDSVTGILAESPTGAAFADAVKRALADKEALAAMRANCLRAAEDALTLEDYTREVLKIYEDAVCRK